MAAWLVGERMSALARVGLSVLAIDPVGAVVQLLRAARLSPIIRITKRPPRSLDLSRVAVALVAADGQPDWTLVADLSARLPTVVLASSVDDAEAERAIDVGAVGYIASTISPDALRRAIRAALDGELAYSRRVLARRMQLRRSLSAARMRALTPRQRDVARLIATGAADKEIARALGISTATVQKHVTNLLHRLGVPNRAAAAAIVAACAP